MSESSLQEEGCKLKEDHRCQALPFISHSAKGREKHMYAFFNTTTCPFLPDERETSRGDRHACCHPPLLPGFESAAMDQPLKRRVFSRYVPVTFA